MAKNGSTRNTDLIESFMEKLSLGFGGPDRATRATTVTEARPIENDDPISSGRAADESARRKILDHACIAMQKDQRLAFALLDEVEANAFHHNKFSYRRIVTLGPFCNEAVDERGYDEACDHDCAAGSDPMRHVRRGRRSDPRNPVAQFMCRHQLEILR